MGQAFLIEAACIQHADADPIQLLLGGNCNERIPFLLVVEYVELIAAAGFILSQGLSKVLEAVGEAEQEAELRVFRVPALNFEALWISYGDEGRDLLVPLHAVGRLVQNEPVPMRDALEALREAAWPLANMDDTMGA
ncbi:hypothetical protein [Nitrosospira multiformis]|uniref:hypothetical protein n=1 Tax=Nitrosospira multiformis TaxID=1231 RepID=UPI00089A4D45|nr:hypothetical protein [Nitrosospira multiformis]SDZ98827.1 hypothetical protein SAMN05216411_103205 [Nitrosospira multiformis]